MSIDKQTRATVLKRVAELEGKALDRLAELEKRDAFKGDESAGLIMAHLTAELAEGYTQDAHELRRLRATFITTPADRSTTMQTHPTQMQMYYQAERQAAGINHTFLEMVADGMTREELQTNINRRPALWARFSNWLDKLPSRPNQEHHHATQDPRRHRPC